MDDKAVVTLPALLLKNSRMQPGDIAIRHKFLGVWQTWNWQQAADETQKLAVGLQQRGFSRGQVLLIISEPRPQALLLALAATWLGGSAALLQPQQPGAQLRALLEQLGATFVFAETLEQVRLVFDLPRPPGLLLYADGRGMAGFDEALVQPYQALLQGEQSFTPVLAQAGDVAFAFYRQSAAGGFERQRISHAELLRAGQLLVDGERLGRHEEALASRAFAAGGQARYLLAPWLLAGFRLNFPENGLTRDNDRRELGPTLVAGTRETYGRLHRLILQRLPEPGSWRRALVDWALRPGRGWLWRWPGFWLVRRPLRDVIGFSRIRAPLLLGEALPADAAGFFAVLGIQVRTWPDPAHWHSPLESSLQPVSGWLDAQ
ncbi:AMP-binding protein [Phytopseudomonas dryadis]|uniref:Long-chain fatty acid--CoA ligase n=1 Tax=Phytopseudomonas dryadis TaxID=2487520 RepID=A0ABY1ZB48_9GAMM|nr:long-chain fatty acid--CoA ligase [Pseudomonas dryadis]TBV19614.1 long-chain fatty acid--CoA ligase [Pseudomonas sp. FRB 230]